MICGQALALDYSTSLTKCFGVRIKFPLPRQWDNLYPA
jgi:hypothetical protein